MRFVAALLVVVEHARDLLFLTAAEAGPISAVWKLFYFVTGFGHQAVMVFFVLSGYWITHSAERWMTRPSFWPGYLVDRLSRLWLVIFPAIAIGLVLDWASVWITHSIYAAGQSGAFTMQHPVVTRLGWPVLVGNVLFLQTIAVPAFGSNGPLWSLAYEFWYYLWFPALALTMRNRRASLALLTFAVAWFNPDMLVGFCVWLMGSALYFLDRRTLARSADAPAKPARSRRGIVKLVLAGGVLVVLLSLARLERIPLGGDLVVGAGFAAFLWQVLRIDPLFPNVVKPVAGYGAGASFSLYVIHFPLIAFAVGVIPPAHRQAPSLLLLFLFVAMVAGAAVVAKLFAKATEARTSQVRGRLAGLLASRGPAAAQT